MKAPDTVWTRATDTGNPLEWTRVFHQTGTSSDATLYGRDGYGGYATLEAILAETGAIYLTNPGTQTT